MEIKLKSIATVKNSRTIPTDDFWETIISEIELEDHIPTEAFNKISDFSHLEIIYFFNKVKSEGLVYSARPRGNPDYRWSEFLDKEKKTGQIQLAFAPLNSWNTMAGQ